jgi:hypothetical protein
MKTPKHCKGCIYLRVQKLPSEGIPYCDNYSVAVTERISGRCKLLEHKKPVERCAMRATPRSAGRRTSHE